MTRDVYRNYAALSANLCEGRDYRVRVVDRGSSAAIVAPHGGGIEAGTSEIAEAVAGDEFSVYCFDGIVRTGNQALHITSTRFDEPRGLALVSRAETVLAIHGLGDSRPVIWIGGLDVQLASKLHEALRLARFEAVLDDTFAHSGSHPDNICNRGQAGRGCQLELSVGLRGRLFENLTRTGRRHRTAEFGLLCEAVRSALSSTSIVLK